MALTQEQTDFFWKNGYLSYGKILEDEEIEILRREYEDEFEKAWQENSLCNLSAEDNSNVEGKKKASQQMLQIEQMCERNIHFRRLVYNQRILDVVQDLIGPNILLFHDQALFKPAHTGGPVMWHQDNAYWKCRPATLISCWMTLDDVDRENGAMQVIPGSQLKPSWPEERENGAAQLDAGEPEEIDRAVVVDLPAGGCMFHHCQTLHYTQPNTTERQRRAFAMHFMQPGTSLIAQGQRHELHPDFSHPVLRMRI
jgi:ectoine hydroxylase-related dioxygenase (phytanoyl-CoA dioxygenase family)